MHITKISFKFERNYPALRIGKYTIVFSWYYWFQTSKAVEVRRIGWKYLGVWIVKELS